MTDRAAGGFDGRGLVLPDGPDSPLPRLRAHYLSSAVRAFVKLGPALPQAKRSEHRRACELVKRELARDPERLLDCFAAPEVCVPLHCELAGYGRSTFAGRLRARLEEVSPRVL